MKPAVGQDAEQRKGGCAHAQNRKKKPDKY
jgi:hypothetical protein